MLWMMKRVFFGEKGELVKDEHHPLIDLNAREIAVMVPLVIMVFWMGIFPNHFLDWSKASVDHLVQNKSNYNLLVLGDGKVQAPKSVEPVPEEVPAQPEVEEEGGQ